MPNSSGPKINTTDNPTGHPITKRDLAKLTGYSYEHIRKMLKGEPVPSREFNRKLCEVLGLEEDRTWQWPWARNWRRGPATSTRIFAPRQTTV